MSLKGVLARFGVNNKRYVTNSGLVVFDGVTKGQETYTHATHGQVYPLARGRFHGGVDPEDAASTHWWLSGTGEIERHVDAVAAYFPRFTYHPGDADIAPTFSGTIDTRRGRFDVTVLLRRDRGLPFVTAPKVRLGKQRGRLWRRAPHLYDSDALCVAAQSDWLPDEHDSATVIAWAAHWLANYTFWFASGVDRWPTEGQDVA